LYQQSTGPVSGPGLRARMKGGMKKFLRIHLSSPTHWVGDGFPVRSVFNYNDLARELSPFLLLDYAAPHKFPPGKKRRGVAAHPHRGIETVTVAYQGELEHRDSIGGGGKVGAGDVQWITAAGGIIHEEFHSDEFTRHGGMLEMAQLWINLPAKHKNTKAGYQTFLKTQIPTVALPQNAGTVRVIAGEYQGSVGPAHPFTPINLWDVNLRADQSVVLPLPDGHTTTFLVLQGDVMANDERAVVAGDLAIFDRAGNSILVKAKTDARLLVMDGEPIDEPIVGQGPFVMNSQAEIQQAFEDYKHGRMGEITD
jgi:redox-sensitive bicupin YhaK (pirin superfamily)